MIQRYIYAAILKDLERKIILLSGPRQVGKTTLSKTFFSTRQYLNWDLMEHRPIVLKKAWDRSYDLLILDELHKMAKFKSFLKGIYDTEGVKPRILVTGSARLDITKKLGDSLAGRYLPFRLHPLDLWELKNFGGEQYQDLKKNYESLKAYSGFPEPFFLASSGEYQRWAKTHQDIILKQDLLDLESVRNISSLETMLSLLQGRVGSTVSARSLAEDLHKDSKTIQNWLMILENLYLFFRVPPYHKNLARALTKEPKYYFYDLARVQGDEGAILENLVALSLQKQLDYLGDAHGIFGQLYFVRTRDGEEIDFYVHWENSVKHPPLLIEVKTSDSNLSRGLTKLGASFPQAKKIQLVLNLDREKHYPSGEKILPLLPWLSEMPLISESPLRQTYPNLST